MYSSVIILQSPVGVNTLTPAQSQYLSQFTQSSESFKNALNSVSASSQATSTQAYPTVFTPTSGKNHFCIFYFIILTFFVKPLIYY